MVLPLPKESLPFVLASVALVGIPFNRPTFGVLGAAPYSPVNVLQAIPPPLFPYSPLVSIRTVGKSCKRMLRLDTLPLYPLPYMVNTLFNMLGAFLGSARPSPTTYGDYPLQTYRRLRKLWQQFVVGMTQRQAL